MKIDRKIQAIALLLFLIGIYLFITQIVEIYLIVRALSERPTARISFGFTTWSIIIDFLFSILLLFGSGFLFRLKKAGRQLINIVFPSSIVLGILNFVVPKLINDSVITDRGYFIFYDYSINWQFVLLLIIYISILVAINLKSVKGQLVE